MVLVVFCCAIIDSDCPNVFVGTPRGSKCCQPSHPEICSLVWRFSASINSRVFHGRFVTLSVWSRSAPSNVWVNYKCLYVLLLKWTEKTQKPDTMTLLWILAGRAVHYLHLWNSIFYFVFYHLISLYFSFLLGCVIVFFCVWFIVYDEILCQNAVQLKLLKQTLNQKHTKVQYTHSFFFFAFQRVTIYPCMECG